MLWEETYSVTDLSKQVGQYLGVVPVRPEFEHSMLTEEQKRMKKALAELFDPSTEGGGNPITKLGALLSTPETFGHYQHRFGDPGVSEIHGVTFNENITPGEAIAFAELMKESGIRPHQAKGKIAIGPSSMSAERVDTVPHELMHKGINYLDSSFPGSLEHPVIHRRMSEENIERGFNERELSAVTKEIGDKYYKQLENRAREEVKKRLKRRPTQ